MHRYFSTPSVFYSPSGDIDRENGIIRGVVIAQEGPAKGHNAFLDQTFLLSIVADAVTKPAGIKARFGHPNMCNNALGSYLGRFKNYSYAESQVKADLYLDATAKNSPSGDLYTYVLDMAINNPTMFGASIYFESAEPIVITELQNNKEIKKTFFRLKELRGTDIVDEPAATNGLFSTTTFPGIATAFLDENPDIANLIFSKPDNVINFFQSYLEHSNMNFSDKIKENFASFIASFSSQSEPASLLPPPAEQDSSFNSLFEAFCTTFPDSFANVEEFTQLQKAESITSFIDSLNASAIEATEKLSESISAFEALNTLHQELILSNVEMTNEVSQSNTKIQTLTDQLASRPSIPINVSDPLLTDLGSKKDKAGKEFVESIPPDERRRLSR